MRIIHPRSPSVAEVASAIPEVRQLITSRLDDQLSPEDYNTLRPRLSAYISRRHEELTTSLAQLVRKTLRTNNIEDPLSLAAAFFQCNACTDSFSSGGHSYSTFQGNFVECMGHVDRYVHWDKTSLRGREYQICRLQGGAASDSNMYDQALRCCFDGHSVMSHCDKDTTFTSEGITLASKIIRACGRDPRTATAAEMDALDALLICNACWPERAISLMTWRGAVSGVHCTF